MCASITIYSSSPLSQPPLLQPLFRSPLDPCLPGSDEHPCERACHGQVCLAIYSSSPLFLLLTPASGSRAISSSVRGTEPSNFTPVSLSGSKNWVRAWGVTEISEANVRGKLQANVQSQVRA